MANYAKDLTKLSDKNIKDSLRELEALEKMQQEYLELEAANTDQLHALYHSYDQQIHNINQKQNKREAALNKSLDEINVPFTSGALAVSGLCMVTGVAGIISLGVTFGTMLFLGMSVAAFGLSVEIGLKPCRILKDVILTKMENKKKMKLESQMKDVARVMDNHGTKNSEIMEEKINERMKTMPEKYEFKKALTQELDLRPDMSKDFLENDKIM